MSNHPMHNIPRISIEDVASHPLPGMAIPGSLAFSPDDRLITNLRGKLLLVHGLIDENVHFRHTARLINALIAARKPYDLLLFPDERHMPRGLSDRIFMEEQICNYFVKHLA